MGDSLKVLFVCTGNILRSMSAEFLFRDYLQKKGIKDVVVSSAGVTARPEPPHPATEAFLKHRGISIASHKQRRLTKKILEDNDCVIAMATNHVEFIKKKFGVIVPLFNEYTICKSTSVLDTGQREGQHTFKNKKLSFRKEAVHIQKMLPHIHRMIPKLWSTVEERYLLFSRIAAKNSSHRNGLRPTILFESKFCVAFMSIDIPASQDGHVLVIPKRRYAEFHEIPKHIQSDLVRTVSIVGKALLKHHEGYNILLNNGSSAGQYMFHTHFHLIPRDKGDNISIENWKQRKQLNKKSFQKMNANIKQSIREVLSKGF